MPQAIRPQWRVIHGQVGRELSGSFYRFRLKDVSSACSLPTWFRMFAMLSVNEYRLRRTRQSFTWDVMCMHNRQFPWFRLNNSGIMLTVVASSWNTLKGRVLYYRNTPELFAYKCHNTNDALSPSAARLRWSQPVSWKWHRQTVVGCILIRVLDVFTHAELTFVNMFIDVSPAAASFNGAVSVKSVSTSAARSLSSWHIVINRLDYCNVYCLYGIHGDDHSDAQAMIGSLDYLLMLQ